MILAITFWMKLIQYNYHPLLDVTSHHFLDETYTVQLSSIVGCNLSSLLVQYNYHPLLDVTCHFLDENYVKKRSSLTG